MFKTMFLFTFILVFFFYGNNSHEVKLHTRVIYGILNTYFFLCMCVFLFSLLSKGDVLLLSLDFYS